MALVLQMEYNREQREVLLSLAKAEMKKQQVRSQVKQVGFLLYAVYKGHPNVVWPSQPLGKNGGSGLLKQSCQYQLLIPPDSLHSILLRGLGA